MISWGDKIIRVQAIRVPRFLWTTASIEVFLGDECILRTGGQFKMTSSYSASFVDGISEHRAVLCWKRPRRYHIPYQLQIDGVTMDDAQVGVKNWAMGYIPAFFIVASVFLLFIFV
jgi:hypothetical protein